MMTREEAIVWLIKPTITSTEISVSKAKELEAYDMAIEALSAEAVPQLNQTDTLIIADALRYLAKDTERHLSDRTRADALRQQFLKYGASMCKGGDDE